MPAWIFQMKNRRGPLAENRFLGENNNNNNKPLNEGLLK